MTVIAKPTSRLNTVMTAFAEAMKSSGIDARNFRVLVPLDQWGVFVSVTTGKHARHHQVTKVRLGTITFLPDE